MRTWYARRAVLTALPVGIVGALVAAVQRSPRADARRLLQMGVRAAENAGIAGIVGYHIRGRSTGPLRDGVIAENRTETWAQLPHAQRSDLTIRVNGAVTSWKTGGFDGNDEWSVEWAPSMNDGRVTAAVGAAGTPDTLEGRVRAALQGHYPRLLQPGPGTTMPYPAPPPGAAPTAIPTVSPPTSQGNLLNAAMGCYTPRITGEETVAGRRVFVLDLGMYRCTAANTPEDLKAIHHIHWIDAETYFILKTVQTSGTGAALTIETTAIEYNPALPPAVFAFPRPQETDAIVVDARPQPYRAALLPREYAPGHEPGG